eukprot:4700723-Amphidinium_carterae.1
MQRRRNSTSCRTTSTMEPAPKAKAKAGAAELTKPQRLLSLRLCYGQSSAADLLATATTLKIFAAQNC